MPHSAALTFSWTTRIPQQLPTSSRVPLPIFWLTRIPSSRNQRQVTFRSLFSFLVNQGSKPQLPASSRIRLRTFWLIRIPSSSNQRQAAFRSLVLFLANHYSLPTATNQKQKSAPVFLDNQNFQLTQSMTSGVPQPSLLPGSSKFPTTSANQQQSSAADFLGNHDSQQQQPTTSGIPQPCLLSAQPGFASSYRPAAELRCRFSG